MKSVRGLLILLLLATFSSVSPARAQGGREGRGKDGPGQAGPPPSTFQTEVPEHAGSIVLARPTRTAITISVLLHQPAEAFLVWGTDAKALPPGGRAVSLKAGEPQAMVLEGLAPDTRYFYELRDAATGKRLLPLDGSGTFHTARPTGGAFTFTISADSHLDEHTRPELYLRTLANALADEPDFHIDLGDTFMAEKHKDRDSALRQYLAQRYYFGSLCHSAPLFLVLGNHDGECPQGPGREPEGLASWSNAMRKRYFPNPVPDGFYGGNGTRHAEDGLLEDYYAWEWGDALFVVLDPFWYSQRQRGGENGWKRTLGTEQFQWLKRTLEGSRAMFKFVFIHHLVGGLDRNARGGAEAAAFYEWGGRSADGTDGFAEHRSGWPSPIHRLLVENRVNAVFHGHDHFYARQELDCIVYQEVPQPGDPQGGTRNAADYGYKSGEFLGSSGHLRVYVSPEKALVQYVRCLTDKDRNGKPPGAALAASYEIPSKLK